MAGTLPIIIELEAGASVETLVLLQRLPGVAKIHIDFDAFGRQKPRKPRLALPGPSNGEAHEPRARDGFSPSKAVFDLFKQKRPLTRKEIKASDPENGERMVANIASMVNQGTLRKVGPAEYDLSAEALRTIAAGQAETGTTTTDSLKSAKTGADLIMLLLGQSPDHIVTIKQITATFEIVGRSPRSVNDQVQKLLTEKKIKRVAGTRGSYTLA